MAHKKNPLLDDKHTLFLQLFQPDRSKFNKLTLARKQSFNVKALAAFDGDVPLPINERQY